MEEKMKAALSRAGNNDSDSCDVKVYDTDNTFLHHGQGGPRAPQTLV